MARVLITGASGFIQPNGRITDRVEISVESRGRLDPVRAELTKLRQRTKDLRLDGTQPNQITEFLKSVDPLRARLAEMGKAFEFIEERISRLALRAASRDPATQQKWVEALREQLDSDLETVNRWRDRPGTAPGHSMAELKCDNRVTLYTRWGDWFSHGAVALSGTMILDWLLRRMWRKVASKES